MSIISLAILIIGNKILKVVRESTNKDKGISKNDKYMLAMIIFILLSILSNLARSLFIIFAESSADSDIFYSNHLVTFSIIWNMGAFMLSIACALNARNWIYFYF